MMDDSANRVSDPYGVIPDDAFPLSYKRYRVTEPFAIFAQSEEQALQRWEFFKEVLGKLFVNEWHSHELVRFVMPESELVPKGVPSIELVEETEIGRASDLDVSMAGGILNEWAWLDPDHDRDWTPGRLAYQIFNGQLEDGEEEEEL